MFCEPYRKALSQAALGDDRLLDEVRAHLASCASCRASFREEQALCALMDQEMRTRANLEVPASLLPRVRHEIAATPAGRTLRISIAAYVASGLAIGAIALLCAVPSKVPSAKPESPVGGVSSPAPNEPSTAQEQRGSGRMFVATGKENRNAPRAVRRAEPEVLVSAEEELGLQRYAESLRKTKAQAAPLIKSSAGAEIEPLQIASVDVKRLSIDPLQSGDSD